MGQQPAGSRPSPVPWGPGAQSEHILASVDPVGNPIVGGVPRMPTNWSTVNRPEKRLRLGG